LGGLLLLAAVVAVGVYMTRTDRKKTSLRDEEDDDTDLGADIVDAKEDGA
jgi:hypothetical protein